MHQFDNSLIRFPNYRINELFFGGLLGLKFFLDLLDVHTLGNGLEILKFQSLPSAG